MHTAAGASRHVHARALACRARARARASARACDRARAARSLDGNGVAAFVSLWLCAPADTLKAAPSPAAPPPPPRERKRNWASEMPFGAAVATAAPPAP